MDVTLKTITYRLDPYLTHAYTYSMQPKDYSLKESTITFSCQRVLQYVNKCIEYLILLLLYSMNYKKILSDDGVRYTLLLKFKHYKENENIIQKKL